MHAEEKKFIKEAALYLEHPSFLVRVTNVLGKPIESAINRLPEKARRKITEVSNSSLKKALGYATQSITRGGASSDSVHMLMTGASGAVGGFFGLMALPVELPVTTIMMLRSIAAIADEYGHDIDDPYVQLDCLSVFSMGSPSKDDDGINSSYFASRVAMARFIDEAAQMLAKKTVKDISHPVMMRFVTAVAARFKVVVTEKAAAQSVPILGAVTGAVLNSAFTSHFNSVARYHFGLKALEKQYGTEQIRSEYLKHHA
jgi:hypothetical protein